MEINEYQLRETHKRLKATHGGVWQDTFAVHYLMKEFNLPEKTAIAQSTFGNNDYGIDAFHLAEDRKNLYLYQFKWSKDYRPFGESIRRLIHAGFERVFGDPTQDKKLNPLVDELKSVLHEKQSIVERVYMHCIFIGDVEHAENSRYLDALREDLEARHYHLRSFFRRDVELMLEFISTEQRRRVRGVRTSRTLEFPLSLSSEAQVLKTPAGQKLVVGLVPLYELHGLYKAMGDRLFDRNIRFGLSADNPPNKEIRKCLKSIVIDGVEPPEAFTFYHNGMSLSAQAIERQESGWKIVEPRVLNGAQTLTSVEGFLDEYAKTPLSKARQEILQRILVLAKFVVSPAAPDFVTTVAINNNRQNPVEPWNLRSNDDVQLRFQDAFRDFVGIYYERQEGAFESYTDSDLEDMMVQASRAVEMRPLAQTLLALQGEVAKMSNMRDVFESDKFYQATFKPQYLDCDFRELMLCYKVQRKLRVMIDAICEQSDKYLYMRRARNLILALAIQGLLNSPNLRELSEAYGGDLKYPAGYTDTLRQLASKRLRFIVRDVVDRDYAEQLENDKLGFLQSNGMFNACMALAKSKYGWTGRGLSKRE